MTKQFLPIEGSGFDVVLVTGDAYVDHPSYGAAVIGRVLEAGGFKVGIIAEPDWRSADDFRRLGRPKLFFGITAGNLDSMVANYTANKKPRKTDEYSPGGKARLRPDRATIVYTNRIREAYDCVPVVLGGTEASLRRLAHYDYWSDKVRRSLLLDSKADILVYGMGERQIVEIANRLKSGSDIKSINDIRGTAVVSNDITRFADAVTLPSFEEVCADKGKFNESFRAIYAEADPFRGRTLLQKYGERFVVQLPPPKPLEPVELDNIYELNYMRSWHPIYDKDGGVPGFETVRFSIISHRGCCGECNFCSLYLHQGRIIQSRSPESIIREVERLAAQEDFKGTITDIGGPTANLYASECGLWKSSGGCANKKCLVPRKCKDLKLGYDKTVKLWKEIMKLPRVKHLFIGSGVRYDLLIDEYSDNYLKALAESHISGQLKVAPEHSEGGVLVLMNKPHFSLYEKFVKRFNEFNKYLGKKQFLVNYFISSHPGATTDDARRLSACLEKLKIYPEQIQDFIPLPMTLSSCMYYTEKDPFTSRKIFVAKTYKGRMAQRAVVQYKNFRTRKYIPKDETHTVTDF